MKLRKSKIDLNDKRDLIKECIRILSLRLSKGERLKRYYDFVYSSPILMELLSTHLSELREVSFNDFSCKQEILILDCYLFEDNSD